jgi:hypothetical protein
MYMLNIIFHSTDHVTPIPYTMAEPKIALHAQTNSVGIPQLIVASKCHDVFICYMVLGKIGVVVRPLKRINFIICIHVCMPL